MPSDVWEGLVRKNSENARRRRCSESEEDGDEVKEISEKKRCEKMKVL